MRTIQRGDVYAEQKYFGCYRAIILDNLDPKMLGRVILQVPEIFGVDLKTDWAFPKNGYLSAKNSSGIVPVKPPDQPVLNKVRDGDKGDFMVPDIGDGVWAEFEAGDPCRPLWSGRWWSEPAGGAETPMLARMIPDESQVAPKGTDQMVTADGRTLTEPPISYDPAYPLDRVIKTKAGIIIEVDDTPDKERIHIWHPARTWTEIHPDGTVTEHVAVRRYMYVEADLDEHIKGQWNIHVVGDATTHIQGSHIELVEGDHIEHVMGNHIQTIDGNKTVVVGQSHTENTGQNIDFTAGNHIGDTAPRIDHN